jgi:hypothetical protein
MLLAHSKSDMLKLFNKHCHVSVTTTQHVQVPSNGFASASRCLTNDCLAGVEPTKILKIKIHYHGYLSHFNGHSL